MLLDVRGHPRDVMGHLLALKYKSVQVVPSQNMKMLGDFLTSTNTDCLPFLVKLICVEKGENSPRDRLIYWDIQGYTVISKDILAYPGIYKDTGVYHRT
jgi:hypothetical protein